jgi:hypothetical protein
MMLTMVIRLMFACLLCNDTKKVMVLADVIVPSLEFDIVCYLERNEDIKNMFCKDSNDIETCDYHAVESHYLYHGIKEQRKYWGCKRNRSRNQVRLSNNLDNQFQPSSCSNKNCKFDHDIDVIDCHQIRSSMLEYMTIAIEKCEMNNDMKNFKYLNEYYLNINMKFVENVPAQENPNKIDLIKSIMKNIEPSDSLTSQSNTNHNSIIYATDIGFHAGYFAEIILSYSNKIHLTSFDSANHVYSKYGKRFIDTKFPKRHTLIIGNKSTTIPQYINENNNKKFDLIFIAGGDDYITTWDNLIFSKKMAHDKTIIIINNTIHTERLLDVYNIGTTEAWERSIRRNIIHQYSYADISQGDGISWGRYIFDVDSNKDKNYIINEVEGDNVIVSTYEYKPYHTKIDYDIDDKNNILKNINNKIDYELIMRNNMAILSEIAPIFNNSDVIIVAKGPTSIGVNLSNVNTVVGINHAIASTNLNYMFANDFPSFFGIEHLLPKIKYIFMPDYPHSTEENRLCKANKNFTFMNAVHYLTHFGFKGKVFVYQLHTSFTKVSKSSDFSHSVLEMISATTTDVAISLLDHFFHVNSIHTYGYGLGKGYNPMYISLQKHNRKCKEYPYANYTKLLNASLKLQYKNIEEIEANNTDDSLLHSKQRHIGILAGRVVYKH